MTKLHSTNYFNTLIQIADDCPLDHAEIPALKGDNKTVGRLQFEILSKNPYKYTSDDVLFEVFAIRNDISSSERKKEFEKYFSKGQPCFRASPLTKQYGWGVHFDDKGRMALIPVESEKYQNFVADSKVKKLKAMKRTR